MGKAKKRIFNKNTNQKGSILKRNKIIEQIISDIRKNTISDKTKNLIGLFGITVEELTESGISYEEVSAFMHLF